MSSKPIAASSPAAAAALPSAHRSEEDRRINIRFIVRPSEVLKSPAMNWLKKAADNKQSFMNLDPTTAHTLARATHNTLAAEKETVRLKIEEHTIFLHTLQDDFEDLEARVHDAAIQVSSVVSTCSEKGIPHDTHFAVTPPTSPPSSSSPPCLFKSPGSSDSDEWGSYSETSIVNGHAATGVGVVNRVLASEHRQASEDSQDANLVVNTLSGAHLMPSYIDFDYGLEDTFVDTAWTTAPWLEADYLALPDFPVQVPITGSRSVQSTSQIVGAEPTFSLVNPAFIGPGIEHASSHVDPAFIGPGIEHASSGAEASSLSGKVRADPPGQMTRHGPYSLPPPSTASVASLKEILLRGKALALEGFDKLVVGYARQKFLEQSIVLGDIYCSKKSPRLPVYAYQAKTLFDEGKEKHKGSKLVYDDRVQEMILCVLTEWQSRLKGFSRPFVEHLFQLIDPATMRLGLAENPPSLRYAHNPPEDTGEKYANPLVIHILGYILFQSEDEDSVGFRAAATCGPLLRDELVAAALATVWECACAYEKGKPLKRQSFVRRAEDHFAIVLQDILNTKQHPVDGPKFESLKQMYWTALFGPDDDGSDNNNSGNNNSSSSSA
ncbi:unnamed protein product [Cyclocybe aegerita]|uniref:DUF6532 domain-containing protein n=1 Tax=Cyclocybe aegerita TaxID=1973307 RepID=A0A8S0VST0_CYCAE|nr:unnamed protein product [Cyclocybe aegerita]